MEKKNYELKIFTIKNIEKCEGESIKIEIKC